MVFKQEKRYANPKKFREGHEALNRVLVCIHYQSNIQMGLLTWRLSSEWTAPAERRRCFAARFLPGRAIIAPCTPMCCFLRQSHSAHCSLNIQSTVEIRIQGCRTFRTISNQDKSHPNNPKNAIAISMPTTLSLSNHLPPPSLINIHLFSSLFSSLWSQ